MKYISIILYLTLFILQGCTSKQVDIPKTQTTVIQDNTEEIDEFEDEYTSEHSENIIDPLGGYNRAMTTFNDTIFTYALNPLSKGYTYITPEPVRKSVSNFIHNIQFPIRLTNNLLQGKLQNASDELERFIVNSTVGIAGLFDPAGTYMGIYPHNEDFGQTLGFYGIGSGFHIVLPFLGPSNVRDSIGLLTDGYLSPLVYTKDLSQYKLPQNYGQAIGILGFDIINKNASHLGAYESLKKDAVDLYPFLRDFYEQKRLSDIKE